MRSITEASSISAISRQHPPRLDEQLAKMDKLLKTELPAVNKEFVKKKVEAVK